MDGDERIFVRAIRQYCAQHDIALDVRPGGWLITMRRGEKRRFAFGYDIGLNSAIAHRLANDKSATAEILAISGVPCVPHHLFLNPSLGEHVAGTGVREAMRRVLAENPQGVVVKPNEGTAGRSVFKVMSREELERAAADIFSASAGLVIAPYVAIEEEVRVILLQEAPMAVYRKERRSVVGDGVHTLRELARLAAPARPHDGPDEREGDTNVPRGERRLLSWRHNLDTGARPVLLEQGDVRDVCVKIAIDAARAVGIDFTSIDLVYAGGAWKVLEINSGVMMEALGRRYPDLVYRTYAAALDRVFGQQSPKR